MGRTFIERLGCTMPSNPKGYRPKRSNEKYPLSIDEQRRLIDNAVPRLRTLVVFMLSTGAHPSVLTDRGYSLDWTKDYYSWNRPKTFKKVRGSWSRAMREQDLKELRKIRSKTGGYYWELIKDLGDSVGLKGLCPLQLRHTHFVNRARLGHNPFDIAHGASTSLETVYDYYTLGMGESKRLSDDDRHFLEWLMEG